MWARLQSCFYFLTVAEAVEPRESLRAEASAEELPADARTLMVDFDHQGVRYKEWRAVVGEAKEYAYEDWPFEGLATIPHLLQRMFKYGSGWIFGAVRNGLPNETG